MAELTDAGIYKEWWANPAVVGLMGFGLTTMAAGQHNVGYWSAGPTLALAITFGGTAQFICRHSGSSKRKHFRRVRLHVLGRILVVTFRALAAQCHAFRLVPMECAPR